MRNEAGIIDAFISYARLNGVMICGPLGYDTTKPRKLGLFRMIMSLSLKNAYQAKCFYNLGSGNEQFKMLRGSRREIEYNAVYCQHLPFYRCFPWMILSWCGRHIVLNVLKKYLL